MLELAKNNLADDRQKNDYNGLRTVVDSAIASAEAEKQAAAEAAPAAGR
jgi:hypothetical protein